MDFPAGAQSRGDAVHWEQGDYESYLPPRHVDSVVCGTGRMYTGAQNGQSLGFTEWQVGRLFG